MKVVINARFGGFSLSEAAARRMAELGHDFSAGVAGFRSTRIFGIGEHAMFVPAQRDRLVQGPGAIRVERNPGVGEFLG